MCFAHQHHLNWRENGSIRSGIAWINVDKVKKLIKLQKCDFSFRITFFFPAFQLRRVIYSQIFGLQSWILNSWTRCSVVNQKCQKNQLFWPPSPQGSFPQILSHSLFYVVFLKKRLSKKLFDEISCIILQNDFPQSKWRKISDENEKWK